MDDHVAYRQRVKFYMSITAAVSEMGVKKSVFNCWSLETCSGSDKGRKIVVREMELCSFV